ncbi:MAG: hypothetical protein KDK70_30545, partial [Myxococcales bacterium]|nr:hypothetical protein [Myxococcales bacterium]
MIPHANPTRSRWLPALALLGTLAVPAAAHAGFEITYLRTDSEGNALTSDRLTANDFTQYLNQASCQCGGRFAVRIFLNNNAGDMSVASTTRVMTYVGTNCSEGQNAISNYPPCVQLTNLPASEYDDQGLVIEFDQVWLSSGTNGVNQPIDGATPQAPCPESQTGTGKVWICVDADNNSQCLSGEFITPTILNSNNTDTSGGSSQPTDDGMSGGGQATGDGITYDYQPPLSNVTGFRSSAGDGKVVIRWDRAEVNDISGFRVLCADQNGNPAKPNLVPGTPTGQARTNGKLYYTADNLCEQPVYGTTPASDGGGRDTDGGDTGGGDTGGGTTGDSGPMRNDDTSGSGTGATGGATGGTDTTGEVPLSDCETD